VSESFEPDASFAPLFETIREFLRTEKEELQEAICGFLEVVIGKAFNWIFESAIVGFIVGWANEERPFGIRAQAATLLSKLVLLCGPSQLLNLLEFPVVECLASLLVEESKEIHEVLQALDFLVKTVVRLDRLGNRVNALIPAIAVVAEVLEQLVNQENPLIVQPARNLLIFLSKNVL
jgi:hypothetical protein